LFYMFLKKVSVLSVVLAVMTMMVYADGEALPLPAEPAALEAAGIRALQQTWPELDGSGVTIAAVCRSMTYFNNLPQNDYRFNMHHYSLRDADVVFEDYSDGKHGISPHSTAVAGVLIGLDPLGKLTDGTAFDYRGVSPLASLEVFEFWRFTALWLFGQKPIVADVITLSLGDIYEAWWTRAIEQLAAENGTVVVAAIGNGLAARDTTLYPAAGANVIGVGVIGSVVDADGNTVLGDFAVPTAQLSSQGPTDDLRSKPDLVAPGTAIIPDAYTENGYSVLTNASSLAAPITAGTAALLLQKAAQDEVLPSAMADAPINCIIKAVLMNSARKLPYWHKGDVTEDDDLYRPLDRLQGAGALDAAAAMAQLTAGQQSPGEVSPLGWDSHAIEPAQTNFYIIDATEAGDRLTATLTWNRHYENQYPFQLKPEQSDLRLELWAIDPNAPDGVILLDVSDSPVDTVEHLWTPLLEDVSHYMLAVRFSPDAVQPMLDVERFALAWSVGSDLSAGHPLWEDLNGDGRIDAWDSLIKALLEQNDGTLEPLDPAFNEQVLGLSPERAELLTTLWPLWRPHLVSEPDLSIE